MFERRHSHKPPLGLLSSFKESFSAFQQAKFDASIFPASPEPSVSAAEITMNFNTGHLGDSDNHFDIFTSDNHSEWKQADGFDLHGAENMALFDSLATPFQHTPNTSSYYAQATISAGPQPPPLMTPLSRTVSHSGTFPGMPNYLHLQDYQMPNVSQQYMFNHFDAYSQSPQILHTPYLGYDPTQASVNPSRLDVSPDLNFDSGFIEEKSPFRFKVALMTGTSMQKENEHYVTYLNKCQPYKITIKDTRPTRQFGQQRVTYRTSIRASFNMAEKRANPVGNWQTWAINRGIEEAQKGGKLKDKLQALEYVAQTKTQHNATHLEMHGESLDGFSVLWTPPAGRQPECEFQFRCNFLSTDFSNCKGVKGISMRLVAKTSIFDDGTARPDPYIELSYCQVKCFRDHGAERKLSNDDAHIKNAIDRYERQIQKRHGDADDEDSVPVPNSGKRKRADPTTRAKRSKKKKRRQREDSETSDVPIISNALGGDLQSRIAEAQIKLRSKLEVSYFTLKCDREDDPDRFPLDLTNFSWALTAAQVITKPEPPKEKTEIPKENAELDNASGANIELASPELSHTSISQSNAQEEQATDVDAAPQRPSHPGRPKTEISSPFQKASHTTSVKVEPESKNDEHQRLDSRSSLAIETGNDEETMKVHEGDPFYEPPPEKKNPNIAFFILWSSLDGKPSYGGKNRAIYLDERTANAFTKVIALKNNIAPNHVRTTMLHLNDMGKDRNMELDVLVDDDVVGQIPERQVIHAEFTSETEQTSRGVSETRYRLTVQFIHHTGDFSFV